MTKEELEKENSRLILGNKLLSEKLISVTREKIDLQKKNTELKEKLEILILVGNVATKGLNNQLSEAKAIIKDYMIIATGDHTTVCSVPEENRCINVLKLNEQAEQFLKECQNEGR